MKPTATIEEACKKYIQAAIKAKEKAKNEDGFWKNNKLERAYDQLCKAVDAQVETGLQWRFTIVDLAWTWADSIRGGDEIEDDDGVDEQWAVEGFTKSVLAHLEALKGHDWVATLPLEHLFNKFPPFTDFGGFSVVNITVSDKVGDAIWNAVALVAKCRHSIMGDLLLNSVIATETLLNPFGKMGTSEGFALFAARLTGKTLDERQKIFADGRKLYGMRNLSVHRSWSGDERSQRENRKLAFDLFRSCLKGVIGWVDTVVKEGGECTEESFQEFRTRTILA